MVKTLAGEPLEHVHVSRDGAVVTVTLNRPQRRNALSLAHLAELQRVLDGVGASDALGVIVAGAGPVFCAGHDFADVAHAELSEVRALLAACTRMLDTLQRLPQVTIARVHALATAAGAQLVASCDLAVAGASARFAAPGGAGGWFCHTPMVALARNVGRKRAMELALTGDVIDAQTALQWGLVNRVAPDEELDVVTAELLGRAIRGSRVSKGIGKATLYQQLEMSQAAAYAYAGEVMATSSQLPDAREAMAAFLEKRAPSWA